MFGIEWMWTDRIVFNLYLVLHRRATNHFRFLKGGGKLKQSSYFLKNLMCKLCWKEVARMCCYFISNLVANCLFLCPRPILWFGFSNFKHLYCASIKLLLDGFVIQLWVISLIDYLISLIKFSYALFKLSMSPKMWLFFHQGRFYVNYLILWALNIDQNKVFYIKTFFIGRRRLFCLMLHGYCSTKYLNLI